jgi:hypothetical protein
VYLLSLKESPCAGSELRRYSYSLCFRRAPPAGGDSCRGMEIRRHLA